MKILYYVRPEKEYGSEIIFDGLCRVLGNENVIEYPEKPTVHSKKIASDYPCFFDYPIIKTDPEKIEMLRNNEFDAILVGCRTWPEEKDRFKGEFFELLQEKSKVIPTFLVDQGDLPGIREDLVKDLNARLYFKRELLRHDNFKNVVPFNYAYSEKYIPEDISTERTTPLFWAGQRNSYRKKLLDACGDLIEKKSFSQEDYRKELLRARIGLNLRGFGFDTVRYYELPAHGVLLFSQRLPIVIENDFVDGESAVFFDTTDELKDKLHYLLGNPEYTDKIRLNGHKHFLKYHTGTVRARQLLERINGI